MANDPHGAEHNPVTPPEPTHFSQPGTPVRKKNHSFLIVLCLVVAVAGFWAYRKYSAASHPTGPAKGAAPVVSVVMGRAIQKDVPIYLDGIGTVQAFNSVTVRVRVDGQIQKIAFVEGQDVKAGDLLAQIDPAPYQAQVAQAEGKKSQDEALLANARLDLKRDDEQIAAKIIAQQVYDTQKALVTQLEATVKADQAAVDSAKVQLNYTTITSPIDGRTGLRLVDEGNIVRANDTDSLVVVSQLHPISLVFTLPEQNLGIIQKYRAEGELAVIAVDRDNTTELSRGKLVVIDNQIDTTTGTLRFKATFPNDDFHLWPGQFVNARLLLTTRKGGIVVPASVVQRGPEGSFAFVVKDDQTVEVRPVKVAQIEAGQALIDEGLKPDEQVVVDGQYRLQTGSHVKAATSAKAE